MDTQLLFLSLFFAFSLGLALWSALSLNEEARSGSAKVDEMFTDSVVFRVMLPYIQTLGGYVEKQPAFDGQRAEIAKKLNAAGKSDAITPSEFIATQIIAGFSMALTGSLFDYLLEMDMVLEIPLMFLLLGFFLPLYSLSEAAKARQKEIRRTIPYSLDLLTLAVEAGLDFTTALSRIAHKIGENAFGREIKRLVRDLNMGKSRAQSLRDMAERTGVEELKTVVAALIQADELGSSLGPTLRVQASDMRRRRFDAAEKAAMEAPVKMLAPLVLFIFPTVFMIIFGPIVIQLMATEAS